MSETKKDQLLEVAAIGAELRAELERGPSSVELLAAAEKLSEPDSLEEAAKQALVIRDVLVTGPSSVPLHVLSDRLNGIVAEVGTDEEKAARTVRLRQPSDTVAEQSASSDHTREHPLATGGRA